MILKIAYYTSGTSGIGRLVHGAAIYHALIRRGLKHDFSILSSCPPERAGLLDRMHIPHIEIPRETDRELLTDNYRDSELYRYLMKLKPDILIVDRMWFTLHRIIHELSCSKLFICSQVTDNFFRMKLHEKQISFQADAYHRVIAIEPFKSKIKMEQINPLIIRNRDEILDRKRAIENLELFGTRKTCFIGMNFEEGYFEKLKDKYSYLENEDYDVVYSTNIYGGGIFPIADYYNAIDLLICSATYNFFWEARYFEKEAIFETVPVRFCDQARRLRECSDFVFKENGADQLVAIMVNL